MRKKSPAVIVEGQLDVIACHRAGIGGAVAPCGTALTDDHVRAIKRFSERAVVCFDNDRAGKKAAAKATLMFLRAGFDVGVVLLEGSDPDDYVKEGKSKELVALVKGAQPAIDVLLSRAKERAEGSISERLKAIDTLLPYLEAHPRELVRNEMVRRAAKAFGEDEAALQREIDARKKAAAEKRERDERAKKEAARVQAQKRPQIPQDQVAQRPPRANVQKRAQASGDERPMPIYAEKKKAPQTWTPEEYGLARSLLCHPQLATRCGVLLDGIKNQDLKSLIEKLSDWVVRGDDSKGMPVDTRSDFMMAVVRDLYSVGAFDDPSRGISLPSAQRVVEDSLVVHDQRPIESKIEALQRALSAPELDDENRQVFTRQLQDLNRERARMKESRMGQEQEIQISADQDDEEIQEKPFMRMANAADIEEEAASESGEEPPLPPARDLIDAAPLEDEMWEDDIF